MTIEVYAEHLVNIRTLTIQVSLSSQSNETTTAVIDASGESLTVSHKDEVYSIPLPARALLQDASNHLHIPSAPSKDISFRIQLPVQPGSTSFGHSSQHDSNVVPWTAASLSGESEVSCGQCSTVIIPRDVIKVWKNLPSENWAEMMDFWHCHRPDVPHDHNHKTPHKGYSADSTLDLHPGVGMVDPTSFLCTAADCRNLQVVPPQVSPSQEDIQCTRCQATIGYLDSSTDGYRLRKLRVSVSTKLTRPVVSYEAGKWLACHLLASIESQGVRKFTVRGQYGREDALKLWIFAPDLNVSTSVSNKCQPMRTVKVLWQTHSGSPTDEGKLDRRALSEADIDIPDEEFALLATTMTRSSSLLPPTSRHFQAWNVALLPRFTLDDLVE